MSRGPVTSTKSHARSFPPMQTADVSTFVILFYWGALVLCGCRHTSVVVLTFPPPKYPEAGNQQRPPSPASRQGLSNRPLRAARILHRHRTFALAVFVIQSALSVSRPESLFEDSKEITYFMQCTVSAGLNGQAICLVSSLRRSVRCGKLSNTS